MFALHSDAVYRHYLLIYGFQLLFRRGSVAQKRVTSVRQGSREGGTREAGGGGGITCVVSLIYPPIAPFIFHTDRECPVLRFYSILFALDVGFNLSIAPGPHGDGDRHFPLPLRC